MYYCIMTTRERILKEAIKQINNRGLSNVGVREIARALEISPGNMSYHFPKKEDLILALLETYSSKNTEVYNAYDSSPASVDRFLQFFKELFENQYAYRGVFIGQEEVSRIVQSASFNYTEVEQRRKRSLANMLRELNAEGELALKENDVTFLVDFLGLFGRFWIMEAFISFPKKSKKWIIDHYLQLLENQLNLFR